MTALAAKAGDLQPAKLAQQVAEEIERDIVGAERRVGESLGTEAELMARYGVGRSVLREALVLISRDGLAEMRRGKIGGLVVAEPSEALIARNLRNYLDLVIADWDELLTVREQFEELALTLAIERFTAADLPVFEALDERFCSAEAGRDRRLVGGDILRAIARATRNPFLSVLLAAFSDLTVERLARADAPSLLTRISDISDARHRQLRAVLGAAPGRALMASAEIFDIFRALARAPVRAAPVDAALKAGIAQLLDPAASAGKRAEMVAQAIREQIVAEALPVGAHLGAEPDLMARHCASRGVLREAVRILEQQSVAGMVRGKGGGLRVLAPAPAAVVRSVSVYLRAAQVHHRHLREVGEAMGRLAAERAARAAEGESERIAAQIERLSRLEGVSLRELAFEHYNVVGDLSGSRAISLVVSIVGNLYALDESEEADQVVIREVVPERLRGLLEAILSGDGDRARRSMALLQRSGARVRMRPLGALAESRLVRPLSDGGPEN